jgi:hypothetical protein
MCCSLFWLAGWLAAFSPLTLGVLDAHHQSTDTHHHFHSIYTMSIRSHPIVKN